MLKLFVVEDHALVREGLMQALQALAGNGESVEVRGAASADEALELLGDSPDIDLILLDVMLPGTGGLALLGALRKRHPAVPVLMLSALDDAETVRRAMRQGAAGFVPKSSSTEVLLGAVREVLDGGHYLPPQFSEPAARAPRGNIQARFRLTAAQMRVLELLVEGKTNREISEVIGVTEGTVKIHVSAIFKALDVSNRSQALLMAGRHGLKAR
ncbi:MAG: response regulator transcription factor [Gammaproteobacteria bacterium]|nr:response regulator transcription factor [Gammaproteobacteria bacterium]MBU1645012.1 response regulator transcription factor [Gammaproteobacteria bacterium]MBU1971213.1 response regulator transcription factor [Gammaproteobacteria bacterium]